MIVRGLFKGILRAENSFTRARLPCLFVEYGRDYTIRAAHYRSLVAHDRTWAGFRVKALNLAAWEFYFHGEF